MNNFQQNLKRHFEELYVKQNLLNNNSKLTEYLIQTKAIIAMQIEQGLKFLEL
jgi:hypothetical protein